MPGPRVAVVQAGVELSLSVQGRAYPRNAVIRALLRVRNVTHHAVELGGDCLNGPARVEVRDASGTIVYPPAVPILAPPTCPPRPNGGLGLHPGQALEWKWYVLLWSSSLT